MFGTHLYVEIIYLFKITKTVKNKHMKAFAKGPRFFAVKSFLYVPVWLSMYEREKKLEETRTFYS